MKPEEINLVRVKLSRLHELKKISEQTFLETYSDKISRENIAIYLAESYAEARLAEEIRHPESEFFFVELNHQVIGYLKLNRGQAQTELQNENGLEIERIYISGLFQGRKIGQLLMAKAISLARENKLDYVWLGVWEQNPKAIGFYEKNGFLPFDKHFFIVGDEEQLDMMMKLTLSDRH